MVYLHIYCIEIHSRFDAVPNNVLSKVAVRSAAIRWDFPSMLRPRVSFYHVACFSVDNNGEKAVNSRNVKELSLTFIGLKPYTRYRVEVAAVLNRDVWTDRASHNFTTNQTGKHI